MHLIAKELIATATVKASATAALGNLRQEDALETALSAVRNSDAMKRFNQMFKSGMLFQLDNKN